MQSSRVQKRTVELNKAQFESLRNHSMFKMHVWGRGTGKTTLIGADSYQKLRHLPRALFFLSAPTYQQIITKSLPPIIDFWNSLGLQEYDPKTKSGHYVVCQKSPAHFDKPYKEPRKYDYCITFWNGFAIEMISMDRPDLARGGNYDGGFIDEVALVKKERLQTVLIPAVRGGKNYFSHPLHGQISAYTSMPWLSTGQYVLGYEAMAKDEPDSFYYSEATALINLKNLGPEWLDNQRKMMDPRIFRIEIMNERLIKSDAMFYFKFDDTKHVYEPVTSYKAGALGAEAEGYSDYNPAQILDISFDFGGRFTCCLVFQSYTKQGSMVERCINSFYVKENAGVDDLVDVVCNHYARHRQKLVRIWGEPRGKDLTAHPITLYEAVQLRFQRWGWQTEMNVVHSYADKHELRYRYINELLSESTAAPRLRFNRDTCKDAIIAIQMAGILPEMKKDKRNERDKAYSQEHATHFTDALDYFLMQKHYKTEQGLDCEAW